MTPVYFRREVLSEYYADPAHYTVSPTRLQAGAIWSIPIAITELGNVQVWLGDLGRMSEAAQHHWQRFATPDEDSVPEWRVRTDIMNEWVDRPSDRIEDLRAAISEVNDAAIEYMGVPCFADPTGMDVQRINALHVPLNRSAAAFQQQITNLAILLVDHLNKGFLDAVQAKRADGQLNRLATWLSDVLDCAFEDAKALIGGLYAVYSIRSSVGSHRAGERGQDALARSEIHETDLQRGFEALCDRARDSLIEIRDALRSLRPTNQPEDQSDA
jgi:hypothetical protein